nr:ABC transporter substrate-binding protein [uncultured Holophaga sp.]
MPSSPVKPAGRLLCGLAAALLTLSPLQAAARRSITAPDGRVAQVPAQPEHIVCLYQPAYDKILMLSRGNRIALMPGEASPWCYRFYPGLRGTPTATPGVAPDAERLLSLKTDLVIYPAGHINPAQYQRAGLPTVCPYVDTRATSLQDFNTAFKRQVLFIGELLGGEAPGRASRYCAYFDSLMSRVQAITSRIPESRKPKVYYGWGTDLCTTQGANTNMRWYTELAGGIYLPKQLPQYFATVNKEVLIAWDPDIILVGAHGSFGAALPKLPSSAMKAARSGRILRIPAGVFYWDMSSCETALLPLFLAKTFHPDLFRNWDLVKELQHFYAEIYGIRVTAQDARRILDGLGPL